MDAHVLGRGGRRPGGQKQHHGVGQGHEAERAELLDLHDGNPFTVCRRGRYQRGAGKSCGVRKEWRLYLVVDASDYSKKCIYRVYYIVAPTVKKKSNEAPFLV